MQQVLLIVSMLGFHGSKQLQFLHMFVRVILAFHEVNIFGNIFRS